MTSADESIVVGLGAMGSAAACHLARRGRRVLGFDLGSDGSLRHILHAEVGGTIEMDGPEVFRRAVRVMVDSALLS